MGKIIQIHNENALKSSTYMRMYQVYFLRSSLSEQTWTLQMIAGDTAGMGFLLSLPTKDMQELIGTAAGKRILNKAWAKQHYYEKLSQVLLKYDEMLEEV